MIENRTRILIVEDHQAVADGLRAMITAESDMTVVGMAASVQESITAASHLSPDVVLLDYALPDGKGTTAGSAIRHARPDTKLIFVTRDDSQLTRREAFVAGARAFVHKSRIAHELLDAIRLVAGGGTMLQPETP